MSWATIAVGVGTAAVGAVSASRTNKKNEGLAEQARSDEKERRAAASKELQKAYKAYEEIKKDRPGISFSQFKNEYVGAITDKKFAEAFRQVKEDDFIFAQKIADMATYANLQNYDITTEAVSGGAYADPLLLIQMRQ
jgi:hypothetical protein